MLLNFCDNILDLTSVILVAAKGGGVPSTSLEINASRIKNFLFFLSFIICLSSTLSCPVHRQILAVVLLICVQSLHFVASGSPWRYGRTLNACAHVNMGVKMLSLSHNITSYVY